MNYQAKPFAAGIDQQGRYVTRQLRFEDSTGMCDTCPGELDTPESVYQAEPVSGTEWPVTAFLGRCAINLLGASVALMAILLLASAVNSGLTKLAVA